jgi:hypothetical protein
MHSSGDDAAQCLRQPEILLELRPTDGSAKFQLRRDFTAVDAAPWVAFARTWGIGIGGFEFIETVDGRRVTYDINTNTNYNPEVEAEAAVPAATVIAGYLGRLLAAAGSHATVTSSSRA